MKVKRQAKIIELITKNEIETQDELLERLIGAGYNVTQATVSRDIRELKITKVAVNGQKQKYTVLKEQDEGLYEKYVQVLRTGFVWVEQAQNIVVVKTVSGMAMAVGAALDALKIEGMVGCIAGDDTVMCAIASTEDASGFMDKVKKLAASPKEKKEED